MSFAGPVNLLSNNREVNFSKDLLKSLVFKGSIDAWNEKLAPFELFLAKNKKFGEDALGHLESLICDVLNEKRGNRKDSHSAQILNALLDKNDEKVAKIIASHYRTYIFESLKIEKSFFAKLKNSENFYENEFFEEKNECLKMLEKGFFEVKKARKFRAIQLKIGF
jgi:hypothetical protein